MIDPKQVSACLVTRGDVSLDEIVHAIRHAGIEDVCVWDNHRREVNMLCYGRYHVALTEARNDYIFIQDDDLIPDIPALLAEYDQDADAGRAVCNNREDEWWRLNGIGSVFHRDLIVPAFDKYIQEHGMDEDFYRVADIVFAYTIPYRRVVLPYHDLPWATDLNRMYHQEGHYTVRHRALDRVRALQVGAA